MSDNYTFKDACDSGNGKSTTLIAAGNLTLFKDWRSHKLLFSLIGNLICQKMTEEIRESTIRGLIQMGVIG